jgi:hypothetical protein
LGFLKEILIFLPKAVQFKFKCPIKEVSMEGNGTSTQIIS